MGKAHIALPDLEANLAHGLTGVSWIISALSLMAVLFAVPTGVLASKIGTKRAVVVGLIVLGLSSFAGSFSRNESELLLSRVGEGIGFLAVIVSAPSVIAVIAHHKDHLLAFGAWGAYVPSGVALGTLLGPYAMLSHGWRSLWLWSSLALFLFAILIQFLTAEPASGDRPNSHSLAGSFQVYGNRTIFLLAGIFGFYTLQHLGIMSLFPSYLWKVLGASPSQAGLLNSLAMASNIAGNVAAGFLLRRVVKISTLIPTVLLLVFCSALLMFESHTIATAFVGAFAFCAVGGAVPGTVLAVLPSYTRSERELPPGNGLLVQGSNAGIMIGPVLVSLLATVWGWSWTPIVSLVSLLGELTLLLFLSRPSHQIL
jgi:MFS family permease